MPSYKLGRTTEDIRREVSAILRELKDPRVSGCMLSVVRVEVTNDLSYCTVYVSAMEGMETAENAVKGLKSWIPLPDICVPSWGTGFPCAMFRSCCLRRPIPLSTAPTFRAFCTTLKTRKNKLPVKIQRKECFWA